MGLKHSTLKHKSIGKLKSPSETPWGRMDFDRAGGGPELGYASPAELREIRPETSGLVTFSSMPVFLFAEEKVTWE